MSWQFSFDPGLRLVGVAFWEHSQLVFAKTLKVGGLSREAGQWREAANMLEFEADGTGPFDFVFYERMQHYAKKRHVRVDDLFQLVGVTGAIISLPPFRSAVLTGFLPGEWTSKKPKNINHLRIWKRLSNIEQQQLAISFGVDLKVLGVMMSEGALVGTQKEHAVDAIGIGLYGLKRL